jgi:hypothetical protein
LHDDALRYMSAFDQAVHTQLHYAGDIAGRARFDVVEQARTNLTLQPHDVTIRDMRSASGELGLDRAGFEFVTHGSAVAGNADFFDANLSPRNQAPELTQLYMREVGDFLQRKTGAKLLFPQLGGLVMRTSHRAARKSWALPANFVHLDYTRTSAPQFLHWSAAAMGITLPPFRRFVAYQTWRAVSPAPHDSTLAICDGRSVGLSESVVFDSVLGPQGEPGKVFEARICRYGPTHQWYFLSNMTLDDLLIFKGYDSDMPDAMNAMHSAFDNPHAGDHAVPRKSMEARFMALYD